MPSARCAITARVTGGDYALPAQQRVARIKAEQSGIEAGLAHLDEFARSRPQIGPDVVQSKAALLSRKGDEKPALRVLDDGLERYPESSICAWPACSSTSAPTARKPRSANCARCSQSGRATPRCRTHLVTRWPITTRRLDEARQLIAAALVQTPDNAAVLDSMGWVLHRQGKHAEALKYLEKRAATRQPTPRSTCTSAKCSGRSATRRPRARPGGRRSSAIPTTTSSASGSSARGPDASGGHRRALTRRIAALGVAGAWLAGCATRPPVVEPAQTARARRPDPRCRNGRRRGASPWPRRARVAAAVSSGNSAPSARNWLFRGPLGAGGLQIVTDGDDTQLTDAEGRALDGETRTPELCSSGSGVDLPLADCVTGCSVCRPRSGSG